jgi:hypothetical protein
MQDQTHIHPDFLQVRRVLAAIAYSNGKVDQDERELLASRMAGEYQLSDAQLQMLVDDAVHSPRVEELVEGIRSPLFIRLLTVDLMTLAIAKQNWDESEMEAAKRAIDRVCLEPDVVAKLSQAFGLLVSAAKCFSEIGSAATAGGRICHG